MNLISFIFIILFLSGCGRKEMPIPEKKDSFPRTYPTQTVDS